MTKTAFIGLGVMGYPMAGHKAAKGHDVTVFNRTTAKAEQWVGEHGGGFAATPREAVEGVDVVCACVGNDDDLRSVTYGDNGILAGMKEGAIFVDHTTASADVAREIGENAASMGIRFVDAPVSGGQAGAGSRRALGDTNRVLWAGWVIETPQQKLFFAGDTGYSKDFLAIGKRFGAMDLSLIPIGAYAPRWFMKAMHCSPEEAVQIHLDVGSRRSVGMHWGTFLDLTDEPMEEPPERLRKAVEAKNLDPQSFITMKHGETLRGI